MSRTPWRTNSLNDLLVRRAQRDAETDLPGSLTDGERDDRVHANARQQQREAADDRQQRGAERRFGEAVAAILRERLDAKRPEVGVERMNLLRHRASEQRRVAGRANEQREIARSRKLQLRAIHRRPRDAS